MIGPGVVRAVLAKADKNLPMNEIADLIKRTAFKITRMGQLVGTQKLLMKLLKTCILGLIFHRRIINVT